VAKCIICNREFTPAVVQQLICDDCIKFYYYQQPRYMPVLESPRSTSAEACEEETGDWKEWGEDEEKVHLFKASDYVRHLHPIVDENLVAQAFGQAFDEAVTLFSHLRDSIFSSRGLLYKCQRHFVAKFNDLTRELSLAADEKRRIFGKSWRMFAAFSESGIEGSKPKTRFIKLADDVYMACQPDLYDFGRMYELKSYALMEPLQPDVELQIKLFGIAYPSDKLFAVGFSEDEKRYIHIQVVPVSHFQDPPMKELIEFGREHGQLSFIPLAEEEPAWWRRGEGENSEDEDW